MRGVTETPAESGQEFLHRAPATRRSAAGDRRHVLGDRPCASGPETSCAGIWPWPRARPFSMASSVSSFAGRRSSRFGPTRPTAPASSSVWQVAHRCLNTSRPVLLRGGELRRRRWQRRPASSPLCSSDEQRDHEPEADEDHRRSRAATGAADPALAVCLRGDRWPDGPPRKATKKTARPMSRKSATNPSASMRADCSQPDGGAAPHARAAVGERLHGRRDRPEPRGAGGRAGLAPRRCPAARAPRRRAARSPAA